MGKYLQNCLALAVVLGWMASVSVATANADDKKEDRKTKTKERTISIVIHVDGDDVDVSSSGFAGHDELSKKIRKQIEKALAGAADEVGEEESPAKATKKKIMILRSLSGASDLENADHSLLLRQLGDSDGSQSIVVRQASGDSEESSHKIGVLIAGTAGLLVSDVTEGSPAQVAGLRGGDVVLTVDGELVGDVSQLIDGVHAAGKEGKPLALRVIRGNETRTVKVVPARTDQEQAERDESEHGDSPRRQTRTRVATMPAELEAAIEKAHQQRQEAEAMLRHHRIAVERAQGGAAEQSAAIRELRTEVQRLREEVRELKRASRRDEPRD